MKRLTFFLFSLLITSISYSQCDSNYLFKKGNKIEISTFWWAGFGKFKELPKINYEVKNVIDSSGWTVSKLLKSSSQNNGKSIFRKEMLLTCDRKNFLYDPSFWLIDTILQKELAKQMDIKTDTLFYFAIGTPMSYPLTARNSDNLQPYIYRLIETDVFAGRDEKTVTSTRYSGYETITYSTTFITPQTSRTDWSSREVNFDKRSIEGIEEITTPAGKWNCFKIVGKDTKAKGLYKNISIVDYFAPGFGLVRTESYFNKRMTAYSEVTKVY